MYVRDAKKREEVWLLDRLEQLDLVDPAFRSRDYVIAIDETTGEKAGFGRIRIHTRESVCELAAIGVLPEWRGEGVGAHVIERLVDHASDHGFETVYAVSDEVEYLTQFNFSPIDTADAPAIMRERLDERRTIDEDAICFALQVDQFTVPSHLRDAFKYAGGRDSDDDPTEAPSPDDEAALLKEELGIDPEATYKYDTNR